MRLEAERAGGVGVHERNLARVAAVRTRRPDRPEGVAQPHRGGALRVHAVGPSDPRDPLVQVEALLREVELVVRGEPLPLQSLEQIGERLGQALPGTHIDLLHCLSLTSQSHPCFADAIHTLFFSRWLV